MNQTLFTHENETVKLDREDIINARDIDAGTTIICESGVLWLTSKNDYKDYMLETGDKLVVDEKKTILIEALSASKLSIIHTN
ncbi:MAG: DUF2917 domain-containing protein [Chloroflexota bacterium]